MSKITTKAILQGLYKYYGLALEHLQQLLESNGIDHMRLEYPAAAGVCFNMNLHSGMTDMIVEIRLVDGVLTAIGEEHAEYPLGTDIDGQDNYVLCNIQALLDAADRKNEHLRRHCIVIDSKSKEKIVAGIKEFFRNTDLIRIGITADIRIGVNERLGAVTCNDAVTYGDGLYQFLHPLDSLSVKELITITQQLNRFIIRKYNT